METDAHLRRLLSFTETEFRKGNRCKNHRANGRVVQTSVIFGCEVAAANIQLAIVAPLPSLVV